MTSHENNHILDTFDIDYFLAHFWQQRPCVIKGYAVAFADLLDPNELAGLACEPDIDSRIVSHYNNKWEVTLGPFNEDSINASCCGLWTLMVQGVDRYIEDGEALMRHFNFIPYWRMDDLLVTFSIAGAGVGAHVDEYDVFIVQGQGQRRWQVGERSETIKTTTPHPKLKQVAEFAPMIDINLEPGDVIYIPPAFPHKGETITDCINYSVGFRAPTQVELISKVADTLLDTQIESQRFTDPQRTLADHPHQISATDIAALKLALHELIDGDTFAAIITQTLSNTDFDERVNEEDASTNVVRLIAHYGEVMVAPALGIRPLYTEQALQSEALEPYFSFYVNGEAFSIESKLKKQALALIERAQTVLNCETDRQLIQIVQDLIDAGYYVLLD